MAFMFEFTAHTEPKVTENNVGRSTFNLKLKLDIILLGGCVGSKFTPQWLFHASAELQLACTYFKCYLTDIVMAFAY